MIGQFSNGNGYKRRKTGTILQLGPVTQGEATTLNVAANIGAFANNVLSVAAHPVISASSDLTLQDATMRNLTRQRSHLKGA